MKAFGYQLHAKIQIGNSGVIPQTHEARYQAKEKCLGIKGIGLTHLNHENEYTGDATQEKLHQAFNVFALGLNAPEVEKLMDEAKQEKYDNWDTETDGKKPGSVDFVRLKKEDLKEIIKATQLRQKETKEKSRSSLDISWSPPKSFSIMHAMADEHNYGSARTQVKELLEYLNSDQCSESGKTEAYAAISKILDVEVTQELISDETSAANLENALTSAINFKYENKTDVWWAFIQEVRNEGALQTYESKNLKKRMEDFLQESVEETMADMEKLAMRRVRSWVRDETGKIKTDQYGNNLQSVEDVHTGNFIYSSFMHYDSRPVELPLNDPLRDELAKKGVVLRDHDGQTFIVDKVMEKGKIVEKEKPFVRDMQLHMHTPISNLTYDENYLDPKTGQKVGQWYPLQSSEFMKQMPYFEAVANQRLAAKLEKAGFQVERDGERWELGWFATGEGRAMIDRFSKPTAQVMLYAQEYNVLKAEERSKINMKIRNNKEEGVSDRDTLMKIWRAQISDYEWERMQREYNTYAINGDNQGKDGYDFTKRLDHHKDSAADCVRYALDVHKMRNAVNKKIGPLRLALLHGVTKTPEEIHAAFNDMIAKGEVIVSKDNKMDEYYTTRDMLQEEEKLVKLAKNLKQAPGFTFAELFARMTKGGKFEASKFGDSSYSQSQMEVIEGVMNHPGKICFIEGDAGTGKTTVGLQIKRAVELTGRRLISTAVATKAKEVLTDDGYGKYLLVDKDNNMVMDNDAETGKKHPRMVGLAEAKAYYKQEYGKKIPPEIQASLQPKMLEEPETLTKVLNGYGRYKQCLITLKNKNAADVHKIDAHKDIDAFKAKMEGQVLFIDEAGQLGTEQGVEVMQMVKDLNMNLILVGDRKQHKSVTRGSLLEVLVKHAELLPLRLNDILRQKDELRVACEMFARGAWDSGLRKLDSIGGVVQVKPEEPIEEADTKDTITKTAHAKMPTDMAELKEQCVDDILKEMTAGRDPTIVVSKHSTGQEIDAMLRERLIALKGTGSRCFIDEDKKHTFHLLVRDKKFEAPAQRMQRSLYSEGMTIQFVQNVGGERTQGGHFHEHDIAPGMISSGTVAKVVAVNKDNTLTLECNHSKSGKCYRIMHLPTRQEDAKNFVVGNTNAVDLCPGDRIMLTKNMMRGKGNMLKNGKSFNVKDIREEDGEHIIVLDSGNGKEIILRPETNPTHANFNRQFYKTSYGAQGGTSSKGKCIVFHEALGSSKKDCGNLYVDLTRAFGKGEIGPDGKNNDLGLYCDSLEAVIEQARLEENEPNSALSFLELCRLDKLPSRPETDTPPPEAPAGADGAGAPEDADDEHTPRPNKRKFASVIYQAGEIGHMWERLKYNPEEFEKIVATLETAQLAELKEIVEREWVLAGSPERKEGQGLRKDRHPDNLIIAREIIAKYEEADEAQGSTVEMDIARGEYHGPDGQQPQL